MEYRRVASLGYKVLFTEKSDSDLRKWEWPKKENSIDECAEQLARYSDRLPSRMMELHE